VGGAKNALRDITECMEPAYISMQRITKFFAEPDVERWACSLNYEDESLTSEDVAGIGFDSASFQWHVPESNIKYPLRKELLPFELVDISIAFPPSKLTLVTGPTGSGKSSLLYALSV
jgi:ABC-type multidrug transport system fused ATPase/permease subunit